MMNQNRANKLIRAAFFFGLITMLCLAAHSSTTIIKTKENLTLSESLNAAKQYLNNG